VSTIFPAGKARCAIGDRSRTQCLAVAAVFAACLVVVTCGPGISAAGQTQNIDWPRWRGPNGDGISHETNWRASWPPRGPRKLWQKKVGTGYASVSVCRGRVYTMGTQGRDETVWCLDAETGNVVWKHSYRCRGRGKGWPGARIAPTIHGDRVYTLSVDGQIFCLDADRGTVVWSKDTKKELGSRGGRHAFSCHPIVDGDKVIVELGARRGSIVAFDRTRGQVVWQAGRDPAGHATPAIFENNGTRCLLVFTARALVAVDLANGRELWRFPCKIKYGCCIATPVVSGDKVFISSPYYDKGSTLLKAAGGKPTVVWHSREMRNHCSTCVLWGGYLYGFDGMVDTRGGKGVLKCLDFKTGQRK